MLEQHSGNKTIAARLAAVRERIHLAAQACGRDSDCVTLLAVSKTQEISKIREAYRHGQRAFGESYAQEALEKAVALRELAIEWHFIGPIQSNKTRAVAEHFSWAHSVDREKIARRLNEQRPAEQSPLQVCVQLDLFNEAQKQGVPLEQAIDLMACVEQLPRLTLRGVMAIPPKCAGAQQAQRQFDAIAAAFATLKQQFPAMDTLSMGMSADLEAAIAAGSTLVRVGTDLFGPRNASSPAR